MPETGSELSLGEWAALALLGEGPSHGFAIARALSPDGEVGAVWSLSRPLVYRALEKLTAAGLVEERRREPGAGPSRRVLAITGTGRRLLAAWLAEPVEHVRDVRTLLMLKLLYLERAGRDPAPLVGRQRAVVRPIVAGLGEQARSATGFERTLLLWRHEVALAALRFLDGLEGGSALSEAARASSPPP